MKKLLLGLVMLLGGVASAQRSVTWSINTSWGLQCSDTANNCGDPISIPMASYQPLNMRVWQPSGTTWSNIETANGVFDDTHLDEWIDQCAANPTLTCGFVLGNAPPWAVDATQFCGGTGCPGPPTDLNASGSAFFNGYITHLVNRCTAALHCFNTVIKYLELWNEFNSCGYWAGTSAQGCTGTGNAECGVGFTPGSGQYEADCAIKLYQMLAGAYSIITGAMPTATILSPNISSANGTTGYMTAMCNFLQQEVSHSNIMHTVYAVHEYWGSGTATQPEASNILSVEKNQASINNNPSSACAPYLTWSGAWTTQVTWQTETGFNTVFPFACGLATAADCAGAPVRQSLLMGGLGIFSVIWYGFYTVFNTNGTALMRQDYTNMQTMLNNQTINSQCTNPVSFTWICNVTESDGLTAARWVWTTNEAGDTYSVPAGYGDYKDLHGGTTVISAPTSIPITPEPVMLEFNAAPPSTNTPSILKGWFD